MPHNLVFGLTLEMTALGSSRTLLRGPGATGWAVYKKENTIKIDRHIETLLLMPHYLVFGSTPRGSIKMPEEWHRKKISNTFPSLLVSIQFVKTRSHRLLGANATGTCFDKFHSHQKRWERVLAMGTCFINSNW